jgi:hypothetical protein
MLQLFIPFVAFVLLRNIFRAPRSVRINARSSFGDAFASFTVNNKALWLFDSSDSAINRIRACVLSDAGVLA